MKKLLIMKRNYTEPIMNIMIRKITFIQPSPFFDIRLSTLDFRPVMLSGVEA